MKYNNYPIDFIISVFNQHNKFNNNSTNSYISNNTRLKYCSIPYVGTASIMISKYLRSIDNSFRIAFSGHNPNYNQFFTKLKDQIDTDDQSGVVYKIPCLNCDCVYIGETKQKLKTRIYQHEYNVKNKDTKTALCNHSVENNHKFNFKNVSILCHENNDKKRLIREAIEIKKNCNSVNFKTDVNRVNDTFAPILNALSRS